MNYKSGRCSRRDGLTLIEVLLVLVILVILGSLVGLAVNRAQKQALRDSAKAQIQAFDTPLGLYQQNIRSYPTTGQGLQALVAAPGDLKNPERWVGSYLKGDKVPVDPWDSEYKYELVDIEHYRVTSAGPDGQFGTEDDITTD
jgi:general secretion pathway protein G